MLHPAPATSTVWFEEEREGFSDSSCHVPYTLAEIPRGHHVSPLIAHGLVRGIIVVNMCNCFSVRV